MAELIGRQASVVWSGNEIDETVLYGHAVDLGMDKRVFDVTRFGDVDDRLVAGNGGGSARVRFFIDSGLATAPPKPTGTHATLTITTVSGNTYAVKGIVSGVNYAATSAGGSPPQVVGYDFRISLASTDVVGTEAITVA
jgi:hypothetical protein